MAAHHLGTDRGLVQRFFAPGAGDDHRRQGVAGIGLLGSHVRRRGKEGAGDDGKGFQTHSGRNRRFADPVMTNERQMIMILVCIFR